MGDVFWFLVLFGVFLGVFPHKSPSPTCLVPVEAAAMAQTPLPTPASCSLHRTRACAPPRGHSSLPPFPPPPSAGPPPLLAPAAPASTSASPRRASSCPWASRAESCHGWWAQRGGPVEDVGQERGLQAAVVPGGWVGAGRGSLTHEGEQPRHVCPGSSTACCR